MLITVFDSVFEGHQVPHNEVNILRETKHLLGYESAVFLPILIISKYQYILNILSHIVTLM